MALRVNENVICFYCISSVLYCDFC